MKDNKYPQKTRGVLCPSSRPEFEHSQIFGVVDWRNDNLSIGYLEKPITVEKETLNLTGNVPPTKIFRIASKCMESNCQHFSYNICTLANRIVKKFDEIVAELPKCQIRKNCKWWHQEGKTACFICPQIMTDIHNPTELQAIVAEPQR